MREIYKIYSLLLIVAPSFVAAAAEVSFAFMLLLAFPSFCFLLLASLFQPGSGERSNMIHYKDRALISIPVGSCLGVNQKELRGISRTVPYES